MSVENLIAGVESLSKGLQQRKKNIAERQKQEQDVLAREQFSKSLGGSLTGMGERGQLISGAVRSGGLDIKEAVSALGGIDNQKLIADLNSRIAVTTDPVERADLMKTVSRAYNGFAVINQKTMRDEAYAKMSGTLQARKEFGVLFGKGGAGGTSEVSSEGMVQWEQEMPNVRDDVLHFFRNNELAKEVQEAGFKPTSGEGFLDIPNEKYAAYEEAFQQYVLQYLDNAAPNLPPQTKIQAAREIMSKVHSKGTNSLEGQVTKEGNIMTAPLRMPLWMTPSDRIKMSGAGHTRKVQKKNQPTRLLGSPGYVPRQPAPPKKPDLLEQIFSRTSRVPALKTDQTVKSLEEDYLKFTEKK